MANFCIGGNDKFFQIKMFLNHFRLIISDPVYMNSTAFIGIAAGILTSTSLVPQLIKIIKEKKVVDVSPWMLIILTCGVGLWCYYGILKNDLPIIITNGFSFLMNLIVLFLKFRYSKKT